MYKRTSTNDRADRRASLAAEMPGQIDCTYYVDRLVNLLARQGGRKQAVQVLGQAAKALSAHGVFERVLDDIDQKREPLGGATPGRR